MPASSCSLSSCYCTSSCFSFDFRKTCLPLPVRSINSSIEDHDAFLRKTVATSVCALSEESLDGGRKHTHAHADASTQTLAVVLYISFIFVYVCPFRPVVHALCRVIDYPRKKKLFAEKETRM